eukprot:1350209-Amphidinium_carterae.2
MRILVVLLCEARHREADRPLEAGHCKERESYRSCLKCPKMSSRGVLPSVMTALKKALKQSNGRKLISS